MKYLSLFLFFILCFPPLRAQDGFFVAVSDSVCIEAGDDLNYNVTSNDEIEFQGDVVVFLSQPSECIGMDPAGNLFFLSDSLDCCGEIRMRYRYQNCEPNPSVCEAEIVVIVKCPKPNCSVVDLSDFLGGDDPTGGNPSADCVESCENASATYYVPYIPDNTYNWSVTGGTLTPGTNSAEADINWGSVGSGSITLSITNEADETTTYLICVDILPGPTADFTKSADTICLNSTVYFENVSTDANSWFWDFGDGFTSTAYSPSHPFTSPGTYTITLTVTKDNFGPNGQTSCCCTDTMSMEVVVDPLPGPDIQWISTLCAGDSSKYWTTATNCGTYNWTVLDENGVAISFTGQGNDTICVVWGDGPFGEIILDVDGCDEDYCPVPSTAIVPIISPVATIDGLTEVCENAVATYTAPKWTSVAYDWQVSGGTILSGAGTNTIVVQWGTAPGPGVINLNYGSDFLGGLPGQNQEDCFGSGDLTVAIRPAFSINGPPLVCAGSTQFYFATNFPSDDYTWSISPTASFTGQGTAFIGVSWDSGPGTYQITATPDDPTAYCNDEEVIYVEVVEVPKPTGIDGPGEICPGETANYFAQSGETGVGFAWTVTGGTPASGLGNPIAVTWNATGPYSISLRQFLLSSPFCPSDTILMNIQPKTLEDPLVISGPSGCTNEVLTYSLGPAQHPDATISWSVSPASAGSVVGGQGTPNAMIQWNNSPGMPSVEVTVSLCDEVLSESLIITLDEAVPPTITQTGVLCPGGSATLDAGGGYDSYNWSTGASSQTISINSAGTYLVTVTEGNCSSIGTFTASEADGPVASISTGDPTELCSNPPDNTGSVTINALTGAGYSFTWFCNGVDQGLPGSQDFFVHNNTMVAGTFNYWVVVTDADGCSNQSNTITVIQGECSGGNGGCNPEDYLLSFTAANQPSNCNIVDFTVSSTANVTLIGWDFNDPDNNINSGSLANASHTYGTAGCYLVELVASVPANNPNQPDCIVEVEESICVPIAADFSAEVSCLDVEFCDLSTFLSGEGPTAWSWQFGDGGTSSAMKPTYTYGAGGTYSVTLTVSNANFCTATFIDDVTVADLPTPTISFSSPTCVGDPINFQGMAPNIISWLWDFGDGDTNGAQNPSHTYNTPGTYTVSLTVVDEAGCENEVTTNITIFPGPPADTIAWSPSLEICEGESVTLTAPSGLGYTYGWSTGATSPSISVNATGSYGVTIVDANDCVLIPDPVSVTVFPAPIARISGPDVICDAGCITLRASLGFGNSYQWFDNTGNPIPGAMANVLTVCDPDLASPYIVEVTDLNGCTTVSDPHTVTLETAPNFGITVVPDSCEGTVSTLSIDPVQTNVIYSWSTGADGNSIDVLLAGAYTATGTDTLTGCSTTASATIYPLPDLCLVPVGCYESCNPDTICGPGGLAAYQWNLDGVPIPGATDSCLIVIESGTYSLTGTTEFGCTLTSDSLILEVIDCGCEGLDISADPIQEEACCWSLSYENNLGIDLLGVTIYTNDANLDLASLAPELMITSSTDNSVGLGQIDGLPLPTGALSNFLDFCFSDVQNVPQQLIIDWYDFDFNVACSDTLYFECPDEADCLYLQSDSIYCADGAVLYEFTICNPNDALFTVGFVDLTTVSPAGIIVTPPNIDLTGNPIVAGECRSFSFTLGGSFTPGEEFCYGLIGHESNPELVDTAICCSLDTTYCVIIPDCDPCDDIGVEYAEPLSSEDGSCCYSIGLFNDYEPDFFDGIALCVISPETTLSIDNPFGSGWSTIASSPTAIQLAISPPLGTSLPLGTVVLPDICIHTETAPEQLLEIKWLIGDSIVCRDTLNLECEPPCGYILEEEIECNSSSTGGWLYSGVIKNTSSFTMGEANIVFTDPAGMSTYNISLPLGGLPPGGFFPFTIPLGAPAMSGDSVCFTVALHELNDDGNHTNCCNFDHCIFLPECDVNDDCICDDNFFFQVGLGIACSPMPAGPGTYIFSPAGNLTECDEVEWGVSGLNVPSEVTTGNEPVDFTITDPGDYEVCFKVTRVDINGEVCEEGLCKPFTIVQVEPVIFPNPVADLLNVALPNGMPTVDRIVLMDAFGRLARQFAVELNGGQQIQLDLSSSPAGVYWLRLDSSEQSWLRKVVIR